MDKPNPVDDVLDLVDIPDVEVLDISDVEVFDIPDVEVFDEPYADLPEPPPVDLDLTDYDFTVDENGFMVLPNQIDDGYIGSYTDPEQALKNLVNNELNALPQRVLQQAGANLSGTSPEDAKAIIEDFHSSNECTFLKHFLGNLFVADPTTVASLTSKAIKLLDPQVKPIVRKHAPIIQAVISNLELIRQSKWNDLQALNYAIREGLIEEAKGTNHNRGEEYATQLKDTAYLYTATLLVSTQDFPYPNTEALDFVISNMRQQLEETKLNKAKDVNDVAELTAKLEDAQKALAVLDNPTAVEERTQVLQAYQEAYVQEQMQPFRFGIDALDGSCMLAYTLQTKKKRVPKLSFLAGQMLILAGQSGVGKTHAVVNMIAEYLGQVVDEWILCEGDPNGAYKDMKPFLFFSLEMDKHQIWTRIMRALVAKGIWTKLLGPIFPKLESDDVLKNDWTVFETLTRYYPWLMQKVVIVDANELNDSYDVRTIVHKIQSFEQLSFPKTQISTITNNVTSDMVTPDGFLEPCYSSSGFIAGKQLTSEIAVRIPPVHAVAIDYLQLLEDDTQDQKHQALTEATILLQRVAKKHRIRMILLSQVTAGFEPVDIANLLPKEAIADSKAPARSADIVLTLQSMHPKGFNAPLPENWRLEHHKQIFIRELASKRGVFLFGADLRNFTPAVQHMLKDFLGWSTGQSAPHLSSLWFAEGKRVFINVAKNRSGMGDTMYSCVLDGRNSVFSWAIRYEKETILDPANFNLPSAG